MTDLASKAFGIFDMEIKAAEPLEGEAPFGAFEAILSAPTLDRDGEIVDAKAFDPLPDHITIDIDHGMSVGTTVGSGTPYYDGDILRVKGTYSSIQRAQEVRTLVHEGHIRHMSVAFMNPNREVDPDDERIHVRHAELLNAAIVPIPANREAAITAAKSLAAALLNERAAEDPTPIAPEPAPAPAAATPAAADVAVQALASLAEGYAALATGDPQ